MCRNIKTLYNFEPPANREEVEAAALQFVRKISGFNKPSRVNQECFEAAVVEISDVASLLLASLQTTSPPRDREIEKEKARQRSLQRFGNPAEV